MVFYRRRDAKTAIRRLGATKDVGLASTGPETGYSFSDTWTKSESTEASAVTPAREGEGTSPVQESRRIFLTPLPRMENREMLEDMVRGLFPDFTM